MVVFTSDTLEEAFVDLVVLEGAFLIARFSVVLEGAFLMARFVVFFAAEGFAAFFAVGALLLLADAAVFFFGIDKNVK
ncbi:MAG TPA: hypothetical protein PKA32_00450 [Candidatus Gracilibacteria bacterium]|nr:hypothetical protein [Candidatus Gracilibacteria bacterium]